MSRTARTARTPLLIAAVASAALLLAGCAGSPASESGDADGDGLGTLKVGALQTPAGDILNHIAENGAAELGLTIEFVPFTERSGQSGTLPDPNSLRAHAIFASVLHLSRLGFMFDPEWWIPEELQASKMSSEQRLLPSSGRALLQKIYGTCSQRRRGVELREDAMPVS